MMGPIMMDVQGTSLTGEDKELIAHPLIGGLILFGRNYNSPEQVSALTAEIKGVKQEILIAVDHEGGRVQRFRESFSAIPAMGRILPLCKNNFDDAKALAYHCGVLIAKEVQSVGVDISFAPVLDINAISQVIGDRSFSGEPDVVTLLAESFIAGMHVAGMKVTGKHFPGHGSVEADSHIALPIDPRTKKRIFSHDMLPFQTLIQGNKIDALMPAHVIYPDICSLSVGFSQHWLQNILRQTLGFNGVIFSDDLSMEGAASIGGFIERAEAAQQAGCDMLLVCNDRNACIDVVDNANINTDTKSSSRISNMRMQGFNNKTGITSFNNLQDDILWKKAQEGLARYIA